MSEPMNREGKVTFNDASINIYEEGLGGSYKEREEWEKKFKKQVFLRIVQQLNRVGWKCVVPEYMIKEYSLAFARNHRYCTKGNLKADLSVMGRCIELKIFQNVNAPDRPDHEGRYQCDKEKHMHYLMRLEVERTRRKIRTYLCNIFSGYEFKTDRLDGRMNKRGVGHLTSMEWLEGCYATSWHFKGDITSYEISDYNRESSDGTMLNHGDRVYFADYKGRSCTGIAYYNINNMWWVVTGKYDCCNKACFDLSTTPPDDVRKKRNGRIREKSLNGLMESCVKKLDFERAALFRDLLSLKAE